MLSLPYPFISGAHRNRADILFLMLEDKGRVLCGVLPDSRAGFVGKFQHLDG